MAEQKIIDGSLALNGKTRIVTIPAAEAPRDGKLRVAAYCRVSSDSEDQLNSFAAQNVCYTALITGNPDWELADIYADGPVIIGLNQVKPCSTRGCGGLVLFYSQMIWGDTTNSNNHSTLPQASSATD